MIPIDLKQPKAQSGQCEQMCTAMSSNLASTFPASVSVL